MARDYHDEFLVYKILVFDLDTEEKSIEYCVADSIEDALRIAKEYHNLTGDVSIDGVWEIGRAVTQMTKNESQIR